MDQGRIVLDGKIDPALVSRISPEGVTSDSP
jgi:hypothetical protein